MAANRIMPRDGRLQRWTDRKSRDQRKLEGARLEGLLRETPKPLLTEFDVAAATGLAVATLRRWRWQRAGPPWLKLGVTVRYDPRALEEWLRSRRALHGRNPC